MSDIIMEEQNLYDIADAIREKLGVTDEYLPSEMAGAVRQISGSSVQSDWDEDDTTADDYIKNKPTNVSDFNNDIGFVTSTVNNLVNYYKKTETYTQAEVDALISAIVTLHIESVSVLPTTDISTTTIYLVPSADPQAQNVKDEYINTDGTSAGWELIGSTAIDLTGYVTDAELTAALADYVTSTALSTALAGYVQKSQTAGLLKNDGTVDTTPYASEDDLDEAIENINASVTNTDPYTFRQGLGTMADMDIIGGTVAWNQLVNTKSYSNTSNTDRRTSVYFRAQFYGASTNLVSTTISQNGVYEYIRKAQIDGRLVLKHSGVVTDLTFASTPSALTVNHVVFLSIKFNGTNPSVTEGIKTDNMQVIDLTQVFGTEIADYIYSLEQANEGDGVSWFRKYFPKDYYPYDAGSLQSVSVGSRKVTGKNLLPLTVAQIKAENPSYTWNGNIATKSEGLTFTILTDDGVKVTGIKVNGTASSVHYLGLTGRYTMRTGSYVLNGGVSKNVRLYDDGNISSEGSDVPFTIDSDATKRWFIRVAKDAVVSNQIIYPMIRFATVSDATYEPYTLTAYPFDSTKELRGLFSLSGNELIANGDIYNADGSVERKYGIVDLGTLNWILTGSGNFTAQIQDIKRLDLDVQICICQKYSYNNTTSVIDKTYWNNVGVAYGEIYIRDTSYSDAATFKTAMSGVMLVYELATPTTESAKPFQNPQRAYPDGTEEFTDGLTRDVMVPVGNNTTYQLSKALIPAEDYTDGAVRVVQRDMAGKAGKDMISDAWLSGKAYSVGDYCIYGDMIYRCIQAVAQGTAILPTNTSYWTPTNIATEIGSLNSRLADVITKTDTHYIYNNGSVDSTLWDNTFTATSNCSGSYSHTAGASNHLFSSGQNPSVWNIAEYVSSNIKVPGESGNYAVVEFDASFTDASTDVGGSGCISQVTILTTSDTELGKYNINETYTGKKASFEVPNCKVVAPLNGNYFFKVKAFAKTGGESTNKVKAYVKLKKIYTVRL